MLQACSMLQSTELRNSVLYVDVYEYDVHCCEHGKGTKVFDLFETADGANEHNFTRVKDCELQNKSLNYSAITVLTSLQFSLALRAEFMSMQPVHLLHLISHNAMAA